MKILVSFLFAGLLACGWIYGSENVQTLAAIYMWVTGGLLVSLSLFLSIIFKFLPVNKLPPDEEFLNKNIVKSTALQIIVFALAIFNCWLAFHNDFVVTSVVYGVGQVMGLLFIQFVKTEMIGE